jgi:DNA polymerase III delta prime subunit
MKIIDNEEYMWSQRYRPQSVEDCILPEKIKGFFKNIVKEGQFQSILLSGIQGSGKTSVAKALCNDIGSSYLIINASEENGIDVLRTKIKQYASTMSVMGEDSHKIIILDEADNLTTATQSALRSFMEEYSKNARFLLTANFKNKIIVPLQSRCTSVDFNTSDLKKPEILKQMLDRIVYILKNEDIQYEKPVLAEIITKWAPDFRRIINELQKYTISSSTNSIDSGILVSGSIEVNIKELVKGLKEKNFKQTRQWIIDHGDIESEILFRKIYDNLREILEPSSIPKAVLILAEYGYRSAFVMDQEINTMACMVEIMSQCSFK